MKKWLKPITIEVFKQQIPHLTLAFAWFLCPFFMDPVLVFCEITCQRLGFEMVLGPEKPEHEIVFPNDSRICHALFDPIFHRWGKLVNILLLT